jgi:hypothetical protein
VVSDQVELVLVMVGGYRVADLTLVLVVAIVALPVSLLSLVGLTKMSTQTPWALEVYTT